MNQTLELEPATTQSSVLVTQSSAPPTRANSAAAKKFNIPGDVVLDITRNLDDEPRGLIRWLHSFGAQNDFSYDALGGMLKRPGGKTYDGNTVYKVLTGGHEAKLDNFIDSIRSLKKYEDERSMVTRIDHVATATSRKIWAYCHGVLTLNKMGFIEGESHIGKTAALKEYARTHNHGETTYIRMPAGGGKRAFMEELAITLRISPQQSTCELRRRLTRVFDRRMLLVVDEAHQMFVKSVQIDTLEFIRELHDHDGCGLVLCGTEVFPSHIQTDKIRKLLGQTTRRSLNPLRLPSRPTTDDLSDIAHAYKLPRIENHKGVAVEVKEKINGKWHTREELVTALETQKEVIRDHSLGVWFTILQSASRMANKHGEKLTWDHIVRARAALKAMETLYAE